MKYIVALVTLFLFSCGHSVSSADIAKLNGYWQIEKVVDQKGGQKDYKGNTVYDYFELKNGRGFRKKVMPQLDGTFQTNNLHENVSAVAKDGNIYLDYNTEFAKWRETVTEITDSEFVVINRDKIEYHYKKAGPINLMGDGKTAQ